MPLFLNAVDVTYDPGQPHGQHLTMRKNEECKWRGATYERYIIEPGSGGFGIGFGSGFATSIGIGGFHQQQFGWSFAMPRVFVPQNKRGARGNDVMIFPNRFVVEIHNRGTHGVTFDPYDSAQVVNSGVSARMMYDKDYNTWY